MRKRTYLILGVFVTMVILLSSSPAQAWPADSIYVMEKSTAPVIDGQIGEGEWTTDEETFRETVSQLVLANASDVSSRYTLELTVLKDTDNIYFMLRFESGLNNAKQNASVGIALANKDLSGQSGMQQTFDRKIAHYNGTGETNRRLAGDETKDLYGCKWQDGRFDQTIPCSDKDFQPGADDSSVDFNASHGVDNEGQIFFEFAIPLEPSNSSEDVTIRDGETYFKIVSHLGRDLYEHGHGAKGTDPLKIQYEPRCFICRPEQGMSGLSIVFNGFFAILLSGIFLSFILSRASDAIAQKMWKVEVDEEMAQKSVIMEMAYYNSSFISMMVNVFFLMFAAISLIYAWWAQWGLIGYILTGLPTLLGFISMYVLIQDNYDPSELEEEKPGVNYDEANLFWILPTAFLGITLAMLVFIGIAVIT